MTTCCPSGSSVRLFMLPGVHPGSTPDWSSSNASVEPYIIEAENLSRRRTWISDPGLTGSRQTRCVDRRIAVSYVTGEIVMRLRAGELRTLLPKIIGAETGAGPYTYETGATDPPYFNVLVDRVNDRFEYQNLKVNRAIIRTRASALQGSNPQPAELRLQLLGIDMENIASPGTYHAIPTGEEYTPFIFEDSTLSVNSTTYEKQDVVVVINNMLTPDFRGSTLVPSAICPDGNRVIQIRTAHPYCDGAAPAAEPLLAIPEAGWPMTLGFSYATSDPGTVSTDLNFGCVQAAPEDPATRGQGRLRMFLDFMAGSEGANHDISWDLDPDTST